MFLIVYSQNNFAIPEMRCAIRSGQPSRAVRTAGDLGPKFGGFMPVSSLLYRGLVPYVR